MLKKMRQCRLNFADNRYDCEAGIIGEHYATELIVTPPAIMPTEAVYRLCFEPGGLSEIILQTTDGAFSYPLPSAVTATPYCCVTLIGYVGSEQIYKSRMVRLHFSQTADGDSSIDLQQPGIVDEVNRNTAARHSHENKSVLDKFAESDGKPTYDGKALGGGSAGDITAEDVGYPNSFGEGAPENVGQALDVLITGFNATRKDILRLNKSEHTHSNKLVLDKFTETDGKPTYDGDALGSDFIIKMTVTSDDNGNYTVTSCDTTVEQIDAAVAAEKRVVVIATDTNSGAFWELPIVQAHQGGPYIFAAYTYSGYVSSTVYKSGENEIWEFVESGISAESIDYSNAALPNVTDVKTALDELVPKSHTHANKDTLDKLSDSNGKLQYNGSDVGLKGDKGDKGDPGSDANVTKANVITALGYTPEAVSTQVTTGSNITLADNTEYRLTDVTTLTLTYPTGDFECWMRLTFLASGNATVTLPTGTKYIGTTPDFKNGETWEMSIKDGVVIAQKVGDGT